MRTVAQSSVGTSWKRTASSRAKHESSKEAASSRSVGKEIRNRMKALSRSVVRDRVGHPIANFFCSQCSADVLRGALLPHGFEYGGFEFLYLFGQTQVSGG